MIVVPDNNLVNVVAQYIAEQVKDIDNFKCDVLELNAKYDSMNNDGNQVDYDRFALPFLWLYYFANAAKVRLACEQLLSQQPLPDLQVLDIGCGSGASLIGFIEFLYEARGISNVRHIKADLVDRNGSQLRVFEETSGKYIVERFGSDAQFTKYCVDINEFLQSERSVGEYSIILISNMLCEVPMSRRSGLLQAIIGTLKSGGALLVVEREREDIFQIVEHAFHWASHETEISDPHKLSDLELLQSMMPIDHPLKKDFRLACAIFRKA